MRRALALLVVLATAAAGCVTPPASTEDVDGAVAARGPFVDPITEDHDHADLAAHALSTPNMHLLGHSHLGGEGVDFTSFGELDIHGTVAVVAAQTLGTPRLGAVVLVDVTDPGAPTRLGYATIPSQAHPLDVKWDEKGEFVYASASGQIWAIDARDPASPRAAGAMLPAGAACHMSALGVVDGAEWFFCTGDAVGMTIYRVVEAADARALLPVAQWRPPTAPRTDGSATWAMGAPHDMTFQADPVDGTPILVLSNRNHGVRVLDVSDPTMPGYLGGWHGEGAEFFSDHLHTAMVTTLAGTRVLIASPEILTAGYPPAVWVLDATDYAAMTLLAEWVAPGEHPSTGFTFTTHQWQVAEGRLYLGYYHAGVWVLDLKAMLVPGFRDDPDRPDVLGYHLPGMAPAEPGLMVPNVWDVNLKDGVIWVTCISSGLYALHYAPDEIGNPAISGFA